MSKREDADQDAGEVIKPGSDGEMSGAERRQEPPMMPRTARLPPPGGPRGTAIIPTIAKMGGENPRKSRSARSERPTPRTNRFTLLAGCVALAAGLGGAAGAVGMSAFGLIAAPPAPVVRAEPREDVHVLRETVGQLRANVKTLSDNLAALRMSVNSASSNVNTQLTKITDSLDRERAHNERRAAAAPAPAPEITGSVSPAAATIEPQITARPAIVEGWTVRRVFNGTALVEGRYGVIEVQPGDELPSLGLIQEIRREGGRWVVITAKGMIVPGR